MSTAETALYSKSRGRPDHFTVRARSSIKTYRLSAQFSAIARPGIRRSGNQFMFGKHTVTLSESAYRRIQKYALSVDASIDRAADYVVNEWMNSTGDRIVRAQETREKMMAGRIRLQIVHRNPTARAKRFGTE
jgi:hypothetical protein